MRCVGRRIALLAVVMSACSAPEEVAPAGDPVFVLAAISLSEAMQEAGARYTADSGRSVRFNFAASNVLARQVREGIAADVILSADELQVNALEEDGLLEPGTRVPLLGNELVVVVPPGSPEVASQPGDLAGPRVRRIAIGDPAGVPAGVYARQYLERTGLWTAVASRLVPTTSVRAALAAVENGHADAAIVYRTDAAIARRARIAFALEGPEAPRIVYPAAVLARSRRKADARAFVDWLQGPEASTIFGRRGFMTPPAS